MKRLLTLLILLAACAVGARAQDISAYTLSNKTLSSSCTTQTLVYPKGGTLVVEYDRICPVLTGTLTLTESGVLTTTPMSTRRVWREIYGARDGKVVLIKTIEAKVVPAQAERVEWPNPCLTSDCDGPFIISKSAVSGDECMAWVEGVVRENSATLGHWVKVPCKELNNAKPRP